MKGFELDFFTKKRSFNSNQQFFCKANYYLKKKKMSLQNVTQANNKNRKKRRKPAPNKDMNPQYLTS